MPDAPSPKTERPIPVYLRVRRAVRERIEEGEYQPGAFIPSVNELAAEFEINRLTVMKALEPLIGEQILTPVVGQGFVVVGERIASELDVMDGFTRSLNVKGVEPSARILKKGIRKAGPLYAKKFDIDPDDDLCYVSRLCYLAGSPISIEDTLFPADLLPDLAPLELSVFSLYDLFSFYGIEMESGWQTLTLAEGKGKRAKQLNIDDGTTVMLFESTSTSSDGRIVEFTRTHTRGDKAAFITQFAL